MTDALVVRSFTEGQELARNLKQSALVPEALRGKEADILFIVLTGAEMGIGPMKSLQAFESIKGRVGMKPVYMMGMVRAHPSIADITLETTVTKAVVTSVRKSSPKILRTEFTMDDAKAAGLTSSEMYRKWPARMLGWRCVAIHCREHHSDITGGHYSSEEVESFSPEEKDVTPAAAAAPRETPPQAADLTSLKAATRVRRIKTVDVSSEPVVSVEEDPATIGWGVNATQRLDGMASSAIEAMVRFAEDAASQNKDDMREVWVDRLARYTAELARRGEAVAS